MEDNTPRLIKNETNIFIYIKTSHSFLIWLVFLFLFYLIVINV